MERYALRTNISSQLLPFLKLTAIVNVNENEYTNSTSGGGGGGNGYDAIQSALTYPSYLPTEVRTESLLYIQITLTRPK